MGATRYYDPQASGLRSVFSWQATVFELVLKRKEFWWYIWWNLCLTSVVIFGVPQNRIEQFNWDAASIMQYVMTFFVTFYNDMCYHRYQELYPQVARFSDGVIDTVQELNVMCPFEELTNHRIAVTKYLLAVVYEHFMTVCGGKMDPANWHDLVEKGLLTQQETELLASFPGGRVPTILTSWVLFIIRDALVQDCMWRKSPTSDGEFDLISQQIVHIYNRFVRIVVDMEKCCNKIGYMVANPVPFSYYHLMNFILLFNILMLATFSALYRSYASVFPFALALLIYNGLREVSTALAEPFGEDAVDFSVPDILRNCFDRTLCMLLAFQRPDCHDFVRKQILNCEDLEERHLRRKLKEGVIGDAPDNLCKGSPATHCRWSEDSIFEEAMDDQDMHRKLRYSLDPKGCPKLVPVVEEVIPMETRRHTAEKAADAAEEHAHALMLEMDDLEFDHHRLLLVLEELEFKFPELLDYPLEVEQRRVDPKLGDQEVTYDEMCAGLVALYTDRQLTDKQLQRHWEGLLTVREAITGEADEGSSGLGREDSADSGSAAHATHHVDHKAEHKVIETIDDLARKSHLRLFNPRETTAGSLESGKHSGHTVSAEHTQESLSPENTGTLSLENDATGGSRRS